jgi:hypothetical protein
MSVSLLKQTVCLIVVWWMSEYEGICIWGRNHMADLLFLAKPPIYLHMIFEILQFEISR